MVVAVDRNIKKMDSSQRKMIKRMTLKEKNRNTVNYLC